MRALLLAAGVVTAFSSGALAERFHCPTQGGNFTFGLSANVAGLDQHASAAGSTRDVAMSIFEVLMARDENMRPLPVLARSVDASPDQRVYTFHLRDGVLFHNGKKMTSADVMASFERYKRLGVSRSIFDPVASWETPDPATFVITLKESRPTFLEDVSVFTVPIVVIPKENADAPAMQLPPIGTGPWQMAEYVPDSHVTLRRFDGYKPDTQYDDVNGFGGYKEACFDRVTFRMMPEAGARIAALQTGEVQAIQDVPATAQKRVAGDKSITLARMDHFWLNVTYPNWSFPPTDNLKLRQAILAVLNMRDIMDAAGDGTYELDPTFQFPGSPYYAEAGKELYDQHNPDKARQLLKEAGYKGEKIVLMTTKEYPAMYNTALVMQQQLQAVGINAELLVLDWPTALGRSMTQTTGWNFFFTGWTTTAALGGAQSLRQIADPANVYKPPGNQGDAEFMADFRQIAAGTTLDERRAAFAKAQARALDQVLAIPLGVLPQVQAIRSNVRGYRTYWSPRLTNVWLQ